MARYRFIQTGNKVICISTYAKKVVKGIAKCSPNDEFDLEFGKELAKLRCDVKIADKRANRAAEKYIEAEDNLYEANQYFCNMKDYYFDSERKYAEAMDKLNEFEEKNMLTD